jgi:hypothetical protein
MKKPTLILLLLSLVALSSACGNNEESTETKVPKATPKPTASPVPQAFPSPTQPGKPPKTVTGLIPSTNPQEQKKTLAEKKGRPDPFAVIPVKPIVKNPVTEQQKTPKKITLSKMSSEDPT